ncbi:MAG: hypothetical protein JF599_13515 [Verrucomicrobia bacterium]|nr:hypothetical protein [Verrucomicrobiota bacterium]
MNHPVHILLALVIWISPVGCQSVAKSRKEDKAPINDLKKSADYSETKEVVRNITDVIIVVPAALLCAYAIIRAGGLPHSTIGADKASNEQQHLDAWLYSENKK